MRKLKRDCVSSLKKLFSPKDTLNLSDWRTWLANAMFYCGLVAIPLAMIFTTPIFLAEKQYGLIWIDIAVCSVIIFRVFSKSRSYRLWGACWLIVLYIMTISFYIQLGPHYARSAWLVMNTVMAALFFGSKGALVTSLFNPLILFGCYFFIGTENSVWAQVHADRFLKYLSFVINTSLIAMASSLLVGVLLDRLEISYRKLKVINDKLNESEKRYRLIAENVADVIWKMDMDLKFQYISPSFHQMQGWTVDEGMQKTIEDLFVPDSLEKVMGLYAQKIDLIRSGSDEAWEPIIFEAELYTKKGATAWGSIQARILPQTETEPMHILGITRDITESRQARELIVQSEKMLSVGGLAAGMAHEINNPLAGMIQNAEVISRRLMDNSMPANIKTAEALSLDLSVLKIYLEKRGIPKMFKLVRETGDRISEIVDNMLSFSRGSDDRKLTLSYSMADLLDKTVDLANADFGSKEKYDFRVINIVREYEKELPLVPCESGKIQQVFLNILNNGAQAMHSAQVKSPRITLKVWFDKSAGMVCIRIEDNGPGIDETVRKRIFEPFFTTKGVGDGTGLGLFVSYFIITEDHHGSIDVDSQAGKGTRFTIKLPANQV